MTLSRKRIMIAGLIMCVALVSGCVASVSPDEIGLRVNLLTGAVSEMPPSDFSFYNILTERIVIYSLVSETYSMSSVTALTWDGQHVEIDVRLVYRVDEARVRNLYIRWGAEYREQLIRPILRTVVRDFAASLEAAALYETWQTEFAPPVETVLAERLSAEGLLVETVEITDVRFSEEFTQAVTAATRAAEAMRTAEAARATAQALASRAAEMTATPTPGS